MNKTETLLITALLLFSSVTCGVGIMMGSLVGGIVADAIGVQPMMLVLSGVTLCGCLLFLVTGGMKSRLHPGIEGGRNE